MTRQEADYVADVLRSITGDYTQLISVTHRGWSVLRWTGCRWVPWDGKDKGRHGAGFTKRREHK